MDEVRNESFKKMLHRLHLLYCLGKIRGTQTLKKRGYCNGENRMVFRI